MGPSFTVETQWRIETFSPEDESGGEISEAETCKFFPSLAF
jgi:hypothetical protein